MAENNNLKALAALRAEHRSGGQLVGSNLKKVTDLDITHASAVARSGSFDTSGQKAGNRIVQGVDHMTWFGPLQPIEPAVRPESAELLGVLGRQWDYPVGYNLRITPRQEELTSFQQLRSLADALDILRIVIETRKDQMGKIPWRIQPREGKTVDDKTLGKLTEFWWSPDKQNTWDMWLRVLLEELFVTDAPALYPRPTKGGKEPWAFEALDGSTIKLLLDAKGRTPLPPGIAYQQILKGMPAVEYTQDELIYRPRNVRVWKAYGYPPTEQILLTINLALRRNVSQLQYFSEGNIPEALASVPKEWCYSDDTEVLTKEGWKYFAEVETESDEFATRNTAGIFEWQKADRITRTPFSGDMIFLKSRTIDCLVSPAHRVLVAMKQDGDPRCEKIVVASDLLKKHNERERIPVTSRWDNGTEIEDVSFNHTQTRGKPKNLSMTGDQFCAFMGAWLSEGSCNRGSIMISQNQESKGHWLFLGMLTDIIGKPPAHDGHSFSFGCSPLVDYLRQFGHSYEKFIPWQIMGAPKRQIKIFLKFYIAGDGSSSHPAIFTSSKRLADQLQELFQKIGKSATIREDDRRGRIVNFRGHKAVTRHVNYVVSYTSSKARKFTVTAKPYDGFINCVSVPNGILYVRRNGKPCWSGNSLDQIAQFQQYWDDTLEGNSAQRRHLKFIPDGMKYMPTKDGLVDLKNMFDEWIARIVCFTFSLPPTAFIRQINRATAVTAQKTATEEGLFPTMQWVKNLINYCLWVYMRQPDVEFSWDQEEDIDPLVQAQIDKIYIDEGVQTAEQIAQARGFDFDKAAQEAKQAQEEQARQDQLAVQHAKIKSGIVGNGEESGNGSGNGKEAPQGTEAKSNEKLPGKGEKAEKLAKAQPYRLVNPPPFERPSTTRATKELTNRLNTFFKKQRRSVAGQLVEAIKPELEKLEKIQEKQD
jgi:hypothetical protein